jgi:lactate permease
LKVPANPEAAQSLLGSPETLVAAIQNVAGSHASMLAPQRVILAGTIVGLLGREGRITLAALPPVISSIAVLVVAGTLLTLL